MSGKRMRGFKWSLLGHLTVLLLAAALGIIPGINCQRQPKETLLPIEFMVDVTPLAEPEVEPEPEPTPQPPEPEPEPTPQPPEPPKPEPTPQPPEPEPPKPKPEPRKRPVVKVSTNIIRRAATEKPSPKNTRQPPAGPKLTPEEIARMLQLGATPSDRTVMAGEDERALASIKTALYTAWVRPSAEHIAPRPARISLTLDRYGAVTGRRLSASSGNPTLDRSVENAAAAIRQIRNIPPGFTDRYPQVNIDFVLD